MPNENHAVEYVPTLRERIGWRLFPAQHCDVPDKPGMHDMIVSETKTELSFADRLRVLVSGRVRTVTKTATACLIGDHETSAVFCVEPPTWLRR